MPLGERKALSYAAYCGCTRGYWYIEFEKDEHGTLRPIGICLVVELEATQTEDAEDKALWAALRFGQVVTAYSGSPLAIPKLERLGRIGPRDGLFEQYNYYYLEGPDALPRGRLQPDELDKLLRWFALLDEDTQYRLELAARWYGMSVGAQDPLDGYLSVWIGLESMGPVLSARVHKDGPKAGCAVCGNQLGAKRDKTDAGIHHTIRAYAPELLVSRSLPDLANVRHRIAHGLKPPDHLRVEAEELLPDLQLSLIGGILTAARPETSAPGSGTAAPPRDFKLYPDARATFRSAMELPHHKPWFEGWLKIERHFTNVQSRLEADGNYIWGARTHLQLEGTVPEDAPEIAREYVIFERRGRSWENRPEEAGYPSIQVVPWRLRPLTPAWQRLLSSNEGDDSRNAEAQQT